MIEIYTPCSLLGARHIGSAEGTYAHRRRVAYSVRSCVPVTEVRGVVVGGRGGGEGRERGLNCDWS